MQIFQIINSFDLMSDPEIEQKFQNRTTEALKNTLTFLLDFQVEVKKDLF